jgi:hypothetical protein
MPTYTISGLRGDTGPQGPAGTDPTVAVGTVSSLSYGSTPTVTNSGTTGAVVLDFGIPTGAPGPTGPTGPAGNFRIRHKYGSFSEFNADTDPENNHGFTVGDMALIGGSESATEYGRIYLYKGSGNGDSGTQNSAWQYLVDMATEGIEGPAGENATIQISTNVGYTDDPANANVINTGTQQDAVLQFTLPRGATGATGATGNGVTSTTLVGSTFTFNFTDGTTSSFTVPTGPAGSDGLDGVGISSAALAQSTTDPANYAITFGLTDTTTSVVEFAKPLNANITVGTVTSLAENASPTVSNSGSDVSAVLDFGIPVGATGAQGVGVSSASIADNPNDSTQHRITFTKTDSSTTTVDFDKAPQGPTGPQGASIADVDQVDVDTIRFELNTNPVTYTGNIDLPRGLTGPSGTLAIGTVTNLNAGVAATVSLDATSTYDNDGNATHAVLNFGLPRNAASALPSITDAQISGGTYTNADNLELRGLLDTNNAVTGYVKIFDSANSTWLDVGARKIDDLSDVDNTTTAPTSGDVLQYDGTNYKPSALGTASTLSQGDIFNRNSLNKNRFINPKMEIFQRKPFNTDKATSDTKFGADRWYAHRNYVTTTDYKQNMLAEVIDIDQSHGIDGNPTKAFRYHEYRSFNTVYSVNNYPQNNAEEYVGQRIEGVRTFAGKTVTVTFWIRRKESPSYSASSWWTNTYTSSDYGFNNSNQYISDSSDRGIGVSFKQYFGSGGSSTVEKGKYIDLYDIHGSINTTTNTVDDFTKVSVTFDIPDIPSNAVIGANDYLEFKIWASWGDNFDSVFTELSGANSDHNFHNSGINGLAHYLMDVTALQVEEGSTYTGLEDRPVQFDYQMALRYFFLKHFNHHVPLTNAYFTAYDSGSSAGYGGAQGTHWFPVPMRVVPSIYQDVKGSFMPYLTQSSVQFIDSYIFDANETGVTGGVSIRDNWSSIVGDLPVGNDDLQFLGHSSVTTFHGYVGNSNIDQLDAVHYLVAKYIGGSTDMNPDNFIYYSAEL